jgi:hypothetical protein
MFKIGNLKKICKGFHPQKKQKSFLQLVLVFSIITIGTVAIANGMAIAFNPSDSTSSFLKSVDPATDKYKIGEELYLETCSGCHIPIPPAVLPLETWKKILENPLDHYGEKVESLVRLTQVLIWNYVSAYSRNLLKDEGQPDFIGQSRYFKALHPQVDLPLPTTHRSCVGCHPNAIKFDYRTINFSPNSVNGE